MRTGGPLAGMKVVELAGWGPGPFCCMLLADLGAEVLRIDRAHGAVLSGPNADFRVELLHRGRRSVAVDLKDPAGVALVLELVEQADVLTEGFRPGVTERMGLGPQVCLQRNPGLVYGRMTGYGQSGPMAQEVGHDLNYVAMSGMQSLIGRLDQPPTPPLSLVGDFGGGGMLLAMGVLAAIFERSRSGRGQVVDAAMVDGAMLLGMPFFGFWQTGTWRAPRGANIVDSGAPFYDNYETADGKWLSCAAIEAHFYRDLVILLELPEGLPDQNDRAAWPALKKVVADAVRRRTRDEWMARVAALGLQPCVSPVLDLDEVGQHEHHVARQSLVEIDGIVQPAPAPRFDRTPASPGPRPPVPGEHTREALLDWGFTVDRIDTWLSDGVLAQPDPEDVNR
ncbi:CoA transferase [Nakamurella sp. YIM 132087]|uniref:CoA transferase n=1 Tax=Nakamurella alba TaxID=2665158 RepID=A0A7K1FEL2_9ACTN|nr:CaiB/BaiF CoA-transferase family protein [Nakamurella alba]MTD12510.1 CoA transferase [Nakamurella alba]